MCPFVDISTDVKALVPFPNKTPLAVKVDAPVPPCSTAKSVPLQFALLTLEAVANLPSPRLVRASDPLSATQPDALPTIKFESEEDSPASADKSAAYA